jgi:2-aminoethylphosphonate-pyruvate transaminase
MKQILLNPGPVNVSEKVRAALARGDACHREPEVAECLARTRACLLGLFDPRSRFDAVFFTGSGTAAVEAAVIAAPRAGRKLLVVANGVYGDRMDRIARAHGIATVRLESEWERPLDLERVEQAAADPEVDVIALVHHETTTGLLNPVAAVGAAARRNSKLFILDTVSGLGGEDLDLDGCGVDLAAGTANKCLGGIPGISFVLVRKDALRRLGEVPPRSLYLNVLANLEAQQGSCGAFTPAVQVLWALEAALAELTEEGVNARMARFRRMSTLLREGIPPLGFQRLLAPALLSNTITSFRLPRGIGYPELHDGLKRRGFVIYAGQGPLAGRIFRVATMGRVEEEDYRRFLQALAEVVG